MVEEGESSDRELITLEESPSIKSFIEGNRFKATKTLSWSPWSGDAPHFHKSHLLRGDEARQNMLEAVSKELRDYFVYEVAWTYGAIVAWQLVVLTLFQ